MYYNVFVNEEMVYFGYKKLKFIVDSLLNLILILSY